MRKSCSAFATPAAVAFFIERDAFGGYVDVEWIAVSEPITHLPGSADHNLRRKWRLKRGINAVSPVERITSWHDNEDVHIAPLMRPAIGVRAEEDDLVGMEALNDLADE